MDQVNIRFYHELNDFLPAGQKAKVISYSLQQSRSVKDFIESMGVPHTEVDIILVNDIAVDFDYPLQGEDDIQVYPHLRTGRPGSDEAEHIDDSYTTSPAIAAELKHLQPKTPDPPRFVLDVHLGRLAAYLRMLGFDTLYRNDYEDPELADISAEQLRILLSCDRQLLMRKQVIFGYFVRSRKPQQQLLEILSRFELYDKEQPFTRCMHCNGSTKLVDKHEIQSQLLPRTKKYYDEFYQCQLCGKVYWKGSHFLKMQNMIDKIRSGMIFISC